MNILSKDTRSRILLREMWTRSFWTGEIWIIFFFKYCTCGRHTAARPHYNNRWKKMAIFSYFFPPHIVIITTAIERWSASRYAPTCNDNNNAYVRLSTNSPPPFPFDPVCHRLRRSLCIEKIVIHIPSHSIYHFHHAGLHTTEKKCRIWTEAYMIKEFTTTELGAELVEYSQTSLSE